MNVLEIHRKNPYAVFITRGGNKVKVKNVRPYVAIIELLDGSGKTQYSVNGLNGYLNSESEPAPLDIVDYERPQYTITVNGKEFHPIKNPKNGEAYSYISISTLSIESSSTWNVKPPNVIDAMLVNLNLVYRTVEEAQEFLNEIIKPNAEIKYE